MLPTNLPPMLAFSMLKPFDSPEFTYEIKWDGFRCLAFIDSETRLLSRNQKELTFLFPELAKLHKKKGLAGCLIDGEVIALRKGKPSFLELQKRAQLRNIEKIALTAVKIPIVYVVFDLLYFHSQPVFNKPIEIRREMLYDHFHSVEELTLATYIQKEGINYFNSVTALGLEGVIAKKNGSLYLPGQRVKTWLKFKRRLLGNFIICGYSINPIRRGELSSLSLGAFVAEELTFFGMVGSGFSAKELALIKIELEKLKLGVSPFKEDLLQSKNITWIRQLIVAEIEYLEITEAGYLRHPVFKRFRPELKPEDCQFEE